MTSDCMLVEKRIFEMPLLETVSGTALKQVRVGYETYGTLSAKRDNVVLIPHYLSGNSHAAGQYTEQDAAPGYWDMLIGPCKAIDTNKYFVVSVDALCNLNTDPYTTTTGPASINPDTGRRYGMSFPVVTMLDSVRVQHALLESLGVSEIHTVMGVSMGSLQAFVWAANYPDQVRRVIGITPNGVDFDDYSIQWANLFAQAIRLDPKWLGGDYDDKEPPIDGLCLAFSQILHAARHSDWASNTFARCAADPSKNPADDLNNKFAVEKVFDSVCRARALAVDANNFLFLLKSVQLYSLMPGSTDGDYHNIKAPVLLIPASSDRMLPKENALRFGELLKQNGTTVEVHELVTSGGHLAGVLEAGDAAAWIVDFMNNAFQ